LLGLLAAAAETAGADYYWDADGDTTAGTGNSSTAPVNNWSAGATYLTWRDGGATGLLRSWGTVDATTATAVFGGDVAGSVNVWGLSGQSVNSLRFERTGYTITSSPLTLVGATPTITTNAGVSTTIASVLQGSAGLTKAGTGYLTLNSANTFTGTTTIDAGTLYLSYVGGTLAGTTAVVVNTGGTLYFQAAERINNAASLTIAGGTLQLSSSGTETVGAVTMAGGRISTGTLTSNTGFELQSGTVDGTLAGTASFSKTTSGTVTLTGTNTYSGTTTVNGGTLALNFMGYSGYSDRTLRYTTAVEITNGGTVQLGYAGDQINDSATLTVNNGTFSMGSFYETVAHVTLDGGGTIKNGQLTSTSAFDLRSGTVTAGLAGTAGLNKTTGGTVTLNRQLNNDYIYTGATSITGGTLVVNGIISTSAAETNRVTVGNGATLAGSGSINRLITIQSGGTIAAGDPTASLGTFTTGAETWADGSTAAFRLSNTSADRLSISGTLAAGSSTIFLTSAGLDTSSLTTASWTLVNASGGITGFSGLTLDTSSLGAFDGIFSLSLGSGDTALLLSYAAVPEPATCALLLGAGTLGICLVRRRRAMQIAQR
jgi:autotransporter-associated beta strand protein